MAISADSVQYGPWFGGVRYNIAVEDAANDELSKMENCRVGPGGFVQKRLGTSSYKSAAAISGDPTVTAAGEFHLPGGATSVFVVAGNKFYEYDAGSSPVWVDRTASITITAGNDNTFEWARAHATLLLTNNTTDGVKKWAGTGNNIANITMPGSATTAAHVAYWDNRAWLGNTEDNDDRLWRSGNDNPDSWGAVDFHTFGSPITGLEPFQNSLSVHTEEGIWTLIPTGNAQVPYQQQQRVGSNPGLPLQGGSRSGRSILSLPNNSQLFVLDDGIYQWDGGDEINKISGPLDLGYWTYINKDRLPNSFAVYYALENEAWFFLPYGSSQTAMNHVMIYNTEMDIWSGPYTNFTRNCASIIDRRPHAGDFDGRLFDHAPADIYSDDGNAITPAYFVTGGKSPNDPSQRLKWLYAKTYYDAVGDFEVSIQQESSGVAGSTQTINMGGSGSTFPMELDEGQLGTLRMLGTDSDLTGYDPHSSLQYQNNVKDEFFRIRHAHLQFKTIGRKRKRKAGVD
jgi:hypothetical protein